MTVTIATSNLAYTPQSANLDGGTPKEVDGRQGVGGLLGANDVDPLQACDDVLKIASQLYKGGELGGEDPLADSRGAPRLDAPSESFSANDMMDLLRSMRGKSEDQQLKTAQQGLETARIKAEKNSDAQLEKIKDWIEKCKEAESKSKAGGIFGWIGKIFAAIASVVSVVVAAVATVATGGAAAPLLALAVVGAISATVSLADAISQECGGPEISVNNLIKTTVGKFLTDVCGVDPKVADNISNVMGGALAIACPVMLAIEPSLLGKMAESIASMSGADAQVAGYIGMAFTIAAAIGVGIAMAVMTGGSSAANSATQTTTQIALKAMKPLNTALSGASTLVSSGTQIAQGGLAISKGMSEKEAQQALAGKTELQAMMVKLQKQMEDGREEIKKIIQQIEESTQSVSKMIAGTSDSMTQIAMNMGGRSTV